MAHEFLFAEALGVSGVSEEAGAAEEEAEEEAENEEGTEAAAEEALATSLPFWLIVVDEVVDE
jgi:hypothetical protein